MPSAAAIRLAVVQATPLADKQQVVGRLLAGSRSYISARMARATLCRSGPERISSCAGSSMDELQGHLVMVLQGMDQRAGSRPGLHHPQHQPQKSGSPVSNAC